MEKRKKIGSMQQLAYARTIQYLDGRAAGLRAVEVKAGGLMFTVALDKCMDIAECSYNGNNLVFLSKPGLQNRQHYDSHGQEAGRSIMGGLLFTCGTDNVGPPDEKRYLPMHGTLRSTPAEMVGIDAFWKGEEYHLQITGQMRQAALFGENILLRRCIETVVKADGSADTIWVKDEYTNEGYAEAPFMLLYHCNLGYPLLDSGCRIKIPSRRVTRRDGSDTAGMLWNQVEEPTDNLAEQVFYHETEADENGKVTIGGENASLGIGLDISYYQAQLPRLTQWKSMASGDYAMGLEPCNCHVNGQEWERKNATLPVIRPGEKKRVDLELQVKEL